eukprot:TRINITY_DN27796_c0_g1_i2.p1 TRINITY_DN27796_c0_g1~~TRINITY_DN27796_c0_g1_i2.p1  ORF type:complete len:226 (+),score=56.55 TRINITY_DN27796_c0_g1_i2:70-747(+)
MSAGGAVRVAAAETAAELAEVCSEELTPAASARGGRAAGAGWPCCTCCGGCLQPGRCGCLTRLVFCCLAGGMLICAVLFGVLLLEPAVELRNSVEECNCSVVGHSFTNSTPSSALRWNVLVRAQESRCAECDGRSMRISESTRQHDPIKKAGDLQARPIGSTWPCHVSCPLGDAYWSAPSDVNFYIWTVFTGIWGLLCLVASGALAADAAARAQHGAKVCECDSD